MTPVKVEYLNRYEWSVGGRNGSEGTENGAGNGCGRI